MRDETLIKRYKNIGYVPQNLEFYLEVESIIKWLFDKFKIHINVQYVNLKFGDDKYHKFSGIMINNLDNNLSNTFYCDNYFKSPYDAKRDALIYFYRAIKFNYIS